MANYKISQHLTVNKEQEQEQDQVFLEEKERKVDDIFLLGAKYGQAHEGCRSKTYIN